MDSDYYTDQVYGARFICDARRHHFKIIKTENFLRLARISYVLRETSSAKEYLFILGVPLFLRGTL